MRHLALLALLLAGCTAQPPTEEGTREVPAPVAAAPTVKRVLPRQVIRTTWSFTAGSDECVAVAASGPTTLQVTVRRDAPLRIVVSLPVQLEPGRRAPLALKFNGPAGQWQVSAQRVTSRQIAAVLESNDTTLSRVLVLLSGGVLEVGDPEQAVPSIGLAPSEAQGQRWFDCARNTMI
jgi:hypothetical protein